MSDVDESAPGLAHPLPPSLALHRTLVLGSDHSKSNSSAVAAMTGRAPGACRLNGGRLWRREKI